MQGEEGWERHFSKLLSSYKKVWVHFFFFTKTHCIHAYPDVCLCARACMHTPEHVYSAHKDGPLASALSQNNWACKESFGVQRTTMQPLSSTIRSFIGFGWFVLFVCLQKATVC